MRLRKKRILTLTFTILLFLVIFIFFSKKETFAAFTCDCWCEENPPTCDHCYKTFCADGNCTIGCYNQSLGAFCAGSPCGGGGGVTGRPPTCNIAISQQIVVDGHMVDYNPYNASHQDSGLGPKLVTYSGKQLFEMGRIPFDGYRVCYFGFGNGDEDWWNDCRWTCSCGPPRPPGVPTGCSLQNVSGSCKGDKYGNNWYLATCSQGGKWGCSYIGAPGQQFYEALNGNFMWLYGGSHVTINPPAGHLVYKISFAYGSFSASDQWSRIVFSRHYREAHNGPFYFPLKDGIINNNNGSKTVYLSPASDSLHIISEGATVLLYNIQVTFIDVSSATGTVDNKVTVVNNSYGGNNSGGAQQYIGNVWLSNTSANGPWTIVNKYNVDGVYYLNFPYDNGRSDYTRMGYEWDLGPTSGTRTVWARVEGIGHCEGFFDVCSDTISFTPAPPLTGTIKGNVYQNEWGVCNNGKVLDGWTATCNSIAAEKTGPTSYRCCANWTGGVCNPNLSYVPPGGTNYVVSVTPPADYSITSCSALKWAGSGPFTTSVLLKSASAPAPDLYLWQGASAWFQTKEGDVHAQGGTITSKIFPDNTYFSDADTGDYPGLISYYNSTDLPPYFGRQGTVPSTKGWLAKDSLSLGSGYDSFYSKLGSPTTAFDCDMSRNEFDGLGGGFYWVDGNCDMNQAQPLSVGGTKKLVIFVNGNLSFNSSFKSLNVDSGAFLAFIVKGDINIRGTVGNKTPTPTPVLEGVYLADGMIYTNSDGDNSGNRLVAEGIFYARDGFSLGRNLKNDCTGICNETTPAELFIFRPDLFVNIPEELKTSYFFEQEIAP